MSEDKKIDVVVYDNEFEGVTRDAEVYMTPGARRYFKRVVVGYVVLAVATVLGIWGVTQKVDSDLREQINLFLVQTCKKNIPALEKFNEAVKLDIAIQQDAKLLNIEQGYTKRAALNDNAIAAKRASLLHIPSEKECEDRKAF